ncbi:Ltp family lipoprotein [Enterococcus diestrammenae]|uniref:Ltp family lipoprotein n=1 Tax=Enterococcus diestrammenae TaxID=1155073 RepID=UPI0022E07FC8|nr:Ltp family lipoprotein [Enterococcus diestrammenae]
MKKSVLGLLICFGLLNGCGANTPKEKSHESADDLKTIESVPQKKAEIKFLTLTPPIVDLESNSFTITGRANPDTSIAVFCDSVEKNGIISDHNGNFSFIDKLPTKNLNYRFTTGSRNETMYVQTKEDYLKQQQDNELVAKKQAEEEKKRQEEEEKRKAEEEKQRQEEEKKRQEEEAAAKAKADKEKKISEASRESRNALQKAYDYLDYTAFSKSGLYEQLLYEDYPEDAAQFAIDNVETDWNQNALQKAIDYLDYTAFSDQGLYEQLVYEGFTAEQAQYAINNLPD